MSRPQPGEDEPVCTACTTDEFLVQAMQEGASPGTCRYCGVAGSTVSLQVFADLVDEVFREHFEPAGRSPWTDTFDSRPVGDEPAWLLQEVARIDEPLANDIVALLASQYAYAEHHDGADNPYSDEFYYVEKDPDTWNFRESWTALCEDIRTRTRYFSPRMQTVLSEIFGELPKHRTKDGGSVLRTVVPGRQGSSFYRARVAFTHAELQAILAAPVRELGPPPHRSARSGRMNAAGISVFYGGTNNEVCIAEVRPPVGSTVVVGRFEVIRPLTLLDLDALTDIFEGGSHFDPSYGTRRGRAAFLHSFVAELTRPVMPQDQDYEYLPTQLVAEYLATSSAPRLDGVLFRSSQTGGKKGRNVTLFNHACAVVPYDLPPGTEVQVHRGSGGPPDDDDGTLHVYEETPPAAKEVPSNGPVEPLDMLTFEPTPRFLQTAEPEPPEKPALRLDVPAIQVHRIEGVRYRADAQTLSRHRMEKRDYKF